MKHPVKPMLCGWATAPIGEQPFVVRPDTAYEVKWDGYRMIAAKTGDVVQLYLRSSADVTDQFPEIVAAVRALPVDCVLDGEAIVLRDGWPSFQDFQNRMGLSKERRTNDLKFMVFDVLGFGDLDIMPTPYSGRRQVLEKLVPKDGGTLMYGPASTDGAALWKFVLEHELEGLIAKPLNSRYLPGERGTWVKIKRYVTETFTVVGYTPGGGRRESTFAALLLAEPDAAGTGLRLCGLAGTGFTDAVLSDLTGRMTAIRRETPTERLTDAAAPWWRNVVWVEPLIQGRVAYSERTDGNGLRGPASWQGAVS